MRIKVVTQDLYQEKYSGIFECKKSVSENIKEYTYNDGLCNNIVIVRDSCVELLRNGEVKSKMLLLHENTTEFEYKNSYMDMRFKLFTESLEIAEERVAAYYTISDESGVVNKIEMEIAEIIE